MDQKFVSGLGNIYVNEILNLTEQLNRSKNATGGLAGIINL